MGLGWKGMLKLLLRMILVDYMLIGVLLSTLFWYVFFSSPTQRSQHDRLIANKVLTQTPSYTNTPARNIEWRYALDVHTNGYAIIILLIYLIQLFLWPLLVKEEWICMFFGNTLYVVALLHYVHVTYLGYAALPTVNKSELVLFLAPVILVLYLASLVGFNVSRACLSWYFGRAV